jgi:hypothetical protein
MGSFDLQQWTRIRAMNWQAKVLPTCSRQFLDVAPLPTASRQHNFSGSWKEFSETIRARNR